MTRAGLLLVLALLPLHIAYAQPAPSSVARLGVRVTRASQSVEGTLFALDTSGGAVTDLQLRPSALQATLDDKPVQLTLGGPRPSIALAAAFLLDSSAAPRVRGAVASAVADSIQAIDINRDTVAVVGTADTASWDQAAFTTSAAELQDDLNRVIQTTPDDAAVSLEQVSNVLRSLSAQPRDARVLLLVVNRPLASLASLNASLGAIRAFAADHAIQISIVALPGAGGQGPAEALAEATPGGRVEYVLNATNQQDISRRINLLLAPVLGAYHFQLAAPADGSHTLSISAPGVALAASATFHVSAPVPLIESLETTRGPLALGESIDQPTWVEVRPIDGVSIDSVEWTLDGHVTQAAAPPWALLVDPEQLGDGTHELSARITSQGRDGPFFSTNIYVPTDFLRSVRSAVRGWGVIALLLIGELIVLVLLLRLAPGARTAAGARQITDFPPTLRLNPLAGRYVAPDVIGFPPRGKLRVGYHPPFMDNHVGHREFARLPYQDIRGDEDAVKDLSRHAACIWRDPKTNDCYIQLGWSGPGEPIRARPQSQVFHFGRPQDASSAPFRLAHHDVVRLGTGVEFVFNQVGLRDKATPESKKLSPFESKPAALPRMAVLPSQPPRAGRGD